MNENLYDRWTVKLFLLEEEYLWNEIGTGLLHIKKEWNSKTELEEDTIIIEKAPDFDENVQISKENWEKINKNADYLIKSKVCVENKYEKQSEQIISIEDKTLQLEFALSFIDGVTCTETWRVICNKIGRNPHKSMDLGDNNKDVEGILNDPNFIEKLLKEVKFFKKGLYCLLFFLI